jgi:hypothetical protein
MSHTILIINHKCNSKQIYLNHKWGISKSQNEIGDKFKVNYETMSHIKCTLPSTVIPS